MQRRISVFLIILLIFTQFMETTSISFANINTDKKEQEELFNVNTTEESTTENAEIEIKKITSENLDNVQVVLPKGSTFDEELTNKNNKENKSVKISYSEKEHVLFFEWEEKSDKAKVNINLKDLQKAKNELIITAQKTEQAEKEIDTNNESEKTEKIVTNIKEKHYFEVKLEENVKETSSKSDKKQNDDKKSKEDKPSITPFAGDLNVDIDISPYKESVESGKAAMYKLVFKTTGSQKKYTNAKIVVDLPKNDYTKFTQDLSELAIAGQDPIYDSDNHQLIYEFDELESGKTYDVIVKVDTENGQIPNGSELIAKASFEAEEFDKVQDDATVLVNASSSISINKKFTGDVWSANETPEWAPRPVLPGKYTKWEIKVAIPKKESGQMYLKEGSKIVLTDTLPSGLTHYRTKINGEEINVNISGSQVVLNFDAPTYEEQKESDKYLFEETIEMWLQTSSNTAGTTQENTAKVNATFIDDSKLEDEASDSLLVGQEGGGTGGGDGYTYAAHFGPLDGNGNSSYNDGYYDINKINPIPTVTDEDTLQFAHDIASMQIGAHIPIPWMQYYYHIDSKLHLSGIETPGGWAYNPVTNHVPGRPKSSKNPNYNSYRLSAPKFNIYVTIEGGDERRRVVTDAQSGTYYSREDLGLSEGDKVTKIEYYFYNGTPAGLNSLDPAKYFFDIEKGSSGTVQNYYTVKTAVAGAAYDDRYGARRYTPLPSLTGAYNSDYDTRNWKNIPEEHHVYWRDDWGRDKYRIDRNTYSLPWIGPRQATIVDNIPEHNSVAKVGIKLEEHEKGEVELGENRMKVTLENVKSSPRNMVKDLQAVALLPLGVSLSNNLNVEYSNASGGSYEIIDNYNNSGRQMIIFTWNEDEMKPGESLDASVNINIDNPNSSLLFDVYGFSGNRNLSVPNTNGNSLTDTILQTDEDDINNDGETDQPRLKSGNVYVIKGSYDLQTEKWVKTGEIKDKSGNIIYDGTEWGKFHQTEPGGNVEYKLDLKNTSNKKFSKMVLIDVLPSTGDLGITDNIVRGSKFTPTLNGPITIPSEWEEKVTVSYSTTKNPQRNDLIKNTEYPDTTTKLGNPEGAENPNWMTESDVGINWSDIHSFKIELKEGETIDPGEVAEIIFTMDVPQICDVPENDIFDTQKDPRERAAWNSFASATDHGQPVEPERVGVYMNATGAIELEKVDEDGNPIKSNSAEFELFQKKFELDEDGNPSYEDKSIGIYETNEEGLIQVDDLEYGSYYFVETKAPEGYELDIENKPFTINSPGTLDNDTCGEVERIKVENKEEDKTGEVELVKKDGKFAEDDVDDKKRNKNRLQGAEFSLYKKGSDDEDELIAEGLTTDENGIIRVEDLEYGDYYFIETKAPDGYALSNEPIEFTIDESEKLVKITVKNYETPDIDKDVEGNKGKYPDEPDYTVDRDKEYVYNILITTPGDIKKYKTLGVTDTLDDRLEFITDGSIDEGWEVTGADKGNIDFVQNGQELKWSVKDLSLLESYSEIKITFTAKIKPDAELTQDEIGIPNRASLEFDNDGGEFSDPKDPPTTPPVTVDPPEGSLKVIKVDKDDNTFLLPGAEFKLTTDKDGNNVVDAKGTIITVNGEEYEGLLENLITRKDGTFTIEGLTPGTYYLHETKAPTYTDADGVDNLYNLLKKPVEVTIVDDETDYTEVTVENSKTGWELPDTGGIGILMIYTVGLILMFVGIIYFLRNRRNTSY